MSTDRTNEAWSHQQSELATLRTENVRLLTALTAIVENRGQPWPAVLRGKPSYFKIESQHIDCARALTE